MQHINVRLILKDYNFSYRIYGFPFSQTQKLHVFMPIQLVLRRVNYGYFYAKNR